MITAYNRVFLPYSVCQTQPLPEEKCAWSDEPWQTIRRDGLHVKSTTYCQQNECRDRCVTQTHLFRCTYWWCCIRCIVCRSYTGSLGYISNLQVRALYGLGRTLIVARVWTERARSDSYNVFFNSIHCTRWRLFAGALWSHKSEVYIVGSTLFGNNVADSDGGERQGNQRSLPYNIQEATRRRAEFLADYHHLTNAKKLIDACTTLTANVIVSSVSCSEPLTLNWRRITSQVTCCFSFNAAVSANRRKLEIQKSQHSLGVGKASVIRRLPRWNSSYTFPSSVLAAIVVFERHRLVISRLGTLLGVSKPIIWKAKLYRNLHTFDEVHICPFQTNLYRILRSM